MTIKVSPNCKFLLGDSHPVESHYLKVVNWPLETLAWFLINSDGRKSVFLGSRMTLGIPEKLWTYPYTSGHHAHNFEKQFEGVSMSASQLMNSTLYTRKQSGYVI